MKNRQLLKAYHSFLRRNSYLLLYVVVAIFAVMALFLFVSQQKSVTSLQIGIVDEDQTTETKILMKAVEQKKEVMNRVEVHTMTETEAQQAVKAEEIDGYMFIPEGTTAAFYKTGSLPLKVVLYDEQSLKGWLLKNVSTSIYDRVIVSEKAILTYGHFHEKATDQEIIGFMLDLFSNALDRDLIFQLEEVRAANTVVYYTMTLWLVASIILLLTFQTIFKMNETPAMRIRLKTYRQANLRMAYFRHGLSALYTFILSIMGLFLLLKLTDAAFEPYNYYYVMTSAGSLLAVVASLLFAIELFVHERWLLIVKAMAIAAVLFLSGSIVPPIYWPWEALRENALVQHFRQIVDLASYNYVVDVSYLPFMISLGIVVLSVVVMKRRGR